MNLKEDKMLKTRGLIVGFALLLFAGCATAPATTKSLPKKRADECRRHCKDLDMELGAVVIVINSAGCVCQPKRPPNSTQPDQRGNAAAIAGGAAVNATIEVQKQRTAPPPVKPSSQPQ